MIVKRQKLMIVEQQLIHEIFLEFVVFLRKTDLFLDYINIFIIFAAKL